MIILNNTILSDDIAEKFFVCHIEKCKAACCVEGDAGAPLDRDELPVLQAIYNDVKPYLSEEGRKTIEEQGCFVLDTDGEYVTPTIGNKECAYSIYDEKGVLHCGIEKAWLDGKTQYRKPISCHLYPARITKYDNFDAINYHAWYVCSPACDLGEKLGVPVYKFLKDALVRKYGEEWYKLLEAEINRKFGHVSSR